MRGWAGQRRPGGLMVCSLEPTRCWAAPPQPRPAALPATSRARTQPRQLREKSRTLFCC